MAVAELKLLGVFELRLSDGEAVDLPGQKDRALLAILALAQGAPQSRDKLAGLLWSDRGDPQARDSLKHALTRVRQCLGEALSDALIADRQTVRLDPADLRSTRCTSSSWRWRKRRRRWSRPARWRRATCSTGSAFAMPGSTNGCGWSASACAACMRMR